MGITKLIELNVLPAGECDISIVEGHPVKAMRIDGVTAGLAVRLTSTPMRQPPHATSGSHARFG
jgi:hypothetical protein